MEVPQREAVHHGQGRRRYRQGQGILRRITLSFRPRAGTLNTSALTEVFFIPIATFYTYATALSF